MVLLCWMNVGDGTTAILSGLALLSVGSRATATTTTTMSAVAAVAFVVQATSIPIDPKHSNLHLFWNFEWCSHLPHCCHHCCPLMIVLNAELPVAHVDFNKEKERKNCVIKKCMEFSKAFRCQRIDYNELCCVKCIRCISICSLTFSPIYSMGVCRAAEL